MNGILNILKPTGMTSHDVVYFVRKTLGIKKVGHAGTLDPNVAGVLVICVGKGTKFSDILMNGDKEYVCELILGHSTDTQDSYGRIVKTGDNLKVKEQDILKVLKEFTGEQLQTPPAYSAVKLNGKKLYEYARQNIAVEKPKRPINIKEITLLKFNNNKILMNVKCSKGTYMRTLCNDIGERLGTLGHMGILIRTAAKGLNINKSTTLGELKFFMENGRLDECLIPIDKMFPMKGLYIDCIHFDKIVSGNEIITDTSELNSDNFYIYCMGTLIGIGHKVDDNKIKMDKLLM